MTPRRPRLIALAGAATALGLAAFPARAQYIEQYLPPFIPGFDETRGLTVLERPRPLYDEAGVRVGSFLFRGGIDERFGYNSNINGTPGGPSSAFLETTPTASAQSDWSRHRLAAAATMDRVDDLSVARESHTDWTASLGGGLTLGRGALDLGYSHVHGNELGTDIGAAAFQTPLPFDVDLLRINGTIDLGRATLTPYADFRDYQFQSAVIGGQTLNERFRNRTVLSAGVTGRYDFGSQRAIVLILQGAHSNFTDPAPNLPSQNSTSFLILPGIDYQATGPWRYRLLVGVEVRQFRAAAYGSETAPVVEASVIWTPTLLTTVTARVRREIEDPQSETTSGFTTTGVGLQIDHELRRNVLLTGLASFEAVDYFQNVGSARTYGLGGTATWLIDPHLSAFAEYHFTRQDGQVPRGTGTTTALLPTYTQNVALIGLRWRL